MKYCTESCFLISTTNEYSIDTHVFLVVSLLYLKMKKTRLFQCSKWVVQHVSLFSNEWNQTVILSRMTHARLTLTRWPNKSQLTSISMLPSIRSAVVFVCVLVARIHNFTIIAEKWVLVVCDFRTTPSFTHTFARIKLLIFNRD